MYRRQLIWRQAVRSAVLGLIILSAAVAGHAQAPQQFDLVCSGTETTINETTPNGETVAPWKQTIAVDLAAKVSNWGGSNIDISSITDAKIVFEDKTDALGHQTSEVDRSSGDFTSLWTGAGSFYERVGAHCVPSRFTGIKPNQF